MHRAQYKTFTICHAFILLCKLQSYEGTMFCLAYFRITDRHLSGGSE